MKKLLLALAVPAAALCLAVPAHADDNQYLSALSQHGITLNNPAGAIRDGHLICANFRQGYNYGQVVQMTMNSNPGLQYPDAVFEVNAARQYIC